MDALTNVHPVIVSRTPGYVQNPFVRGLWQWKFNLKKPSTDVSDHEYSRSMAETTAVTLDSDGVDRSTCNMSNKSKPGEAMVWESFRVATFRDCCKTAVRGKRKANGKPPLGKNSNVIIKNCGVANKATISFAYVCRTSGSPVL
ncbi:hypothetical protein Trydic_g7943 [Trypoxylus dichotomus]